MRRRIHLLVTIGLLTSSLLSGCFGTAQTKDPVPGDERQTRKVNRVSWFSGVSTWTPPMPWSTDPQTVQGAISEQTGLAFDFEIPVQDGDTKLSLMLVSGQQLPDVMTTTNLVLAEKLGRSGKVWNLEELLRKYDPKSHLLDGFPEDIKQAVSERDGGWFAFPSHNSSPDARKRYPPSDSYYVDGIKYRNNFGMMINRRILDELGLRLEDVGTEAGLMEAYRQIQLKGLTVNGEPVIPLQIDGGLYQTTTLVTLQDMFGAMPVDRNGMYRNRILAPETQYALRFLNRSVQAGYMAPTQMTMDPTSVKEAVTSGKVFSFIGNTANTGLERMDYWVSPGPLLSSEGTRPVLWKRRSVGTGWMQTFIAKTARHPEKLAGWLSYMTSEEGMLLHYFGFEGRHYTLNDRGLLVQTEEGIQAQADHTANGVGIFWPFANISWHDSVKQAPSEAMGGNEWAVMEVQTAFGKSEHTVNYDTTPLTLPPDFISSRKEWVAIEERINVFKKTQIAKIIMAENDETFIRLYEAMIAGMKRLGSEQLDAAVNEQIQKQMDATGIYVKGVNS